MFLSEWTRFESTEKPFSCIETESSNFYLRLHFVQLKSPKNYFFSGKLFWWVQMPGITQYISVRIRVAYESALYISVSISVAYECSIENKEQGFDFARSQEPPSPHFLYLPISFVDGLMRDGNGRTFDLLIGEMECSNLSFKIEGKTASKCNLLASIKQRDWWSLQL